jgi:hypothetical protein
MNKPKKVVSLAEVKEKVDLDIPLTTEEFCAYNAVVKDTLWRWCRDEGLRMDSRSPLRVKQSDYLEWQKTRPMRGTSSKGA